VNCSFCYTAIPENEKRFTCCSIKVCAECFGPWVYGSQRDNAGFQLARCYCGTEVPVATVRLLLGEETFAKYDEALMRQCLLRAGDAVIFCPGADCKMVVFRPAKMAGVSACRQRACEGCNTKFCAACGASWTPEHEKLSCKRFKELLQSRDTTGLEVWRKTMPKKLLKACPGCKRPTEKNGGCSSHACTLCGIQFCWRCCHEQCCCDSKRQTRQRRMDAWKVRRQAKITANPSLAPPPRRPRNFGGNNNNEPEEVAVPVVTAVSLNGARLPVVGARKTLGAAPSVAEQLAVASLSPAGVAVIEVPARAAAYQDFDIVVLNPRSSNVIVVASEVEKPKKRRNKKSAAPAVVAVEAAVKLTKNQRRKASKQAKWITV
jgi:hypothetical protein